MPQRQRRAPWRAQNRVIHSAGRTLMFLSIPAIMAFAGPASATAPQTNAKVHSITRSTAPSSSERHKGTTPGDHTKTSRKSVQAEKSVKAEKTGVTRAAVAAHEVKTGPPAVEAQASPGHKATTGTATTHESTTDTSTTHTSTAHTSTAHTSTAHTSTRRKATGHTSTTRTATAHTATAHTGTAHTATTQHKAAAQASKAHVKGTTPVRHIALTQQPAAQPARVPLGTFMVTCYDLTGPTASGALAGPESVAVDPSVIPLGTTIYVPGIGDRTADDTGGMIIGDHIDIWEPTYGQCADWGVRYVSIYRVQ